MEKEIAGFPLYFVTTEGKIISYKFKQPRVLQTWLQKSGYENIKLSRDNQSYHFLIHRLVAEAFIPNPNNLPEVNHKNKIRNDNRVENLEWCDRITNLYDSYSTMSSVRNHHTCVLINEQTNETIQIFNSVKDAAEFASINFQCSKSGLIRNYRSKGYRIELIKCND